MTNIINTPNSNKSPEMWQYPPGSDTVASQIEEAQQHNYAAFIAAPDVASMAVEQGMPLSPIREGAVNAFESVPSPDTLVGYADRHGDAIDPQAAEAVLADAAQSVNEAFAAMPQAQQERLQQEHLQAANARAREFGPTVVMMRDGAYDAQFLTKKDFGLGA